MEWYRLKAWGELLSASASWLHSLSRSNYRAKRNYSEQYCKPARKNCWYLQEASVDDPDLKTELSMAETETQGWEEWTIRVTGAVGKACRVNDRSVPVSDVRFTHSSISTRFLHGAASGTDLESLVEDLRVGRVDPLTHEDLVLRAVLFKGRIHSLDNRRLWALQQHQLLLPSRAADVQVRIRILPWTEARTLIDFFQAYETNTGFGESALDGMGETTLRCAVLPSEKSSQALGSQELKVPGQCERMGQSRDHNEIKPSAIALQLGDEEFSNWKYARTRVQSIMAKRRNGFAVPECEFRLLLDVFKRHPRAHEKRVDEAIIITVGTSAKYPDTLTFWMWRADGTGEDISVNICWKAFDHQQKSCSSKEGQRANLTAEGSVRGSLIKWMGAYGFATVEDSVRLDDGHVVSPGVQLYLAWGDVLSGSKADLKFGAMLSFSIYRWKIDGKLGCTSAQLL